jgi:hypothetical protein
VGLFKSGGPGGIPTHDKSVSSGLLYALSYRPKGTTKGQQFQFGYSGLLAFYFLHVTLDDKIIIAKSRVVAHSN